MTVLVQGSDFLPSSVIEWNGAPLPTSFISSTQLSALVPASTLAGVDGAIVTVVNPAPDGPRSATAAFSRLARNPVPSITSLSPTSAAAGSPALQLSVVGSDFVSTSRVSWRGSRLTTTYVSSTQLTAVVPRSDLSSAGSASVAVINPSPGGGTSNALAFAISASNPTPSITSLSPASAAAGSPALTLTVIGSDFVASSLVDWNGVALTTTYVSSTKLTASVPVSDLSSTGSANITVVNPAPGGGTSGILSFTIDASNPVPTITTLSPASAAAGSLALTLTVDGTNFVSSSVVDWNGSPLATTYVNATQLRASVPASDLASAGSANVTVVNSTPGGGTSGALSFAITPTNPAPTLGVITPTSTAAGSTGFTLTVNGSGFIAASAVDWNGSPLTTTYVNASQVTAAVPASDLTSAGIASVTVVNPAPGGGTSTAASFTINPSNPVPSVASLLPTSAAAGAAGFTLTVGGSGFVAASAVDWNGTPLTTTYVSATQLTAAVPASDLTDAGSASVTVFSPAPGGGSSNTLSFGIIANNPAPLVTSLSPTGATAGSAGFTLTVDGTDFLSTSVVQWNGVALTTSYVNASQLTAAVPAADLSIVTSASITVFNPAPGGGTSSVTPFPISDASGATAYIRQWAQYNAYPGNNSTAWNVTLSNVLAGSTIYVVGTWPNFTTSYPTMAVTDSGKNAYTLLDRYDDRTLLNLGIQGTQSIGHWYAANVPAGTYTVNMSPKPGTWEDFAGLWVCEVAGVSSTPLQGHGLNFQASVPPGSNTLTVSATSSIANNLMIAVSFDDVDATAPTVPLLGTAFSDAGQLWDFFKAGRPSGRAEYALFGAAGLQTATFSPEEAAGPHASGSQLPNYLTVTAIFY